MIFGFDYELPLSGARSIDVGLFNPAEKLLEAAQAANIPICLFSDILSYHKFKEWGNKEYCSKYEAQTQKAIDYGNEIQLHIHPQWLETTYNDDRFYPPLTYSLADYADPQGEFTIENIIQLSQEALSDLCKPFDSNFKSVAYRAGGLTLYPHTKRIITALMENGIKIDSTIAKGYYWVNSQLHVDFRNMPAKPIWFLSPDNAINEEGESGIFEIPIAGKPKNFITNFPTRFKRKKYAYREYDCQALPWPHSPKSTKWDHFLNSFTPRVLGFDFFTQNVEDVMSVLEYNLKIYDKYDTVYLSTLGHPKLMGDYAIETMLGFVKRVREKYSGLVEFTTFKKIAENLKK